jgi:coenzyme F420-dependent glucose-6-phosphate dehydrogenase
MATIAYHASHEQFAPSRLLRLAQQAETTGFTAIHSSDHFHPWSTRQGHSGFAFAWLGAALQTTSLPFSMVCAPGQRYHPAVVAQAIATLGEMFPGRFSIELGSGEAVNEKITGEPWPLKPLRNERLLASHSIIADLLEGKEVTRTTGPVTISEARLYSLPRQRPPLFCAALSEQTCRWAGEWADGLLTTGGPVKDVKQKIMAFRENGGGNKPVYVQYSFSYARSRKAALEDAYDQWRSNVLPVDLLNDLWKPEQFDAAAESISLDTFRERLPISDDPGFFAEKFAAYLELGIDRLILHNVNTFQEDFVADFGELVAQLADKYSLAAANVPA